MSSDGLSFWHEQRFEEIKQSDQTNYNKSVALANLMTAMEHANTTQIHIAILESPLGEFYRTVRKLRDELE